MNPTGRRVAWPLWLLAAPAFVAVWSGWVGLGRLCGFGIVQPLPGIWDSLHLDTSITLPIGVEAYAAYALRVWLGSDCSARAVDFARRSVLTALSLGAFGQVVFHLLSAAGVHRAPWPVTVLVAVIPVIVLGMGATLAHLVQQPATREHATPAHHPRQSAPTTSPRMQPTLPARPPAGGGATRERRPHEQRPAARTAGDPPGGDTGERVSALVREDRHVTTAAIAYRLGVSQRTARRHRAAALKDLEERAGEEGAAA
ncbi:MAG: hypothetical protein ACRDUV_22735 [Pseudonocardiaceae bacterium]